MDFSDFPIQAEFFLYYTTHYKINHLIHCIIMTIIIAILHYDKDF